MRILIAILVGFFFSIGALAKSAVVDFPVDFSIIAPNPVTIIEEKLVLNENGEGTVSTMSPFGDDAMENMIGTFHVALSHETMDKLKALVTTTQASVRSEKKFPAEAMILYLKTGKAATLSWLAEGPISSQWQDLYKEIRKQALKNPLSALRLRCEADEGSYLCLFRNVGTEKVVTIDPLSVPRSLSCLPDDGIPRFLSGQKEQNMKFDYRKIEMAPQTSHSFKIVTKDRCTTRLRVNVSNVRANPKFPGVLAGELISNELH